jgi:TetR/AcrR family transcriptional regulator, cholesterol catabolism regulator
LRRTADLRKQQIIEEATRLFSNRGYDKVTTKDLAASCGVSEPALYRYFPSKEAIYDVVLNSLESRLQVKELFDRLENERDVEKLLYDLANHIFEFFRTNQDVYRLMLYSTLGGHAKAKRIYRAVRGTYVDFLIRQLDRFAAAGLILPRNNEITGRCFVGMVFECALSGTLWRGFLGKRYRLDDVVSNNIPIFARGLKT